MKINLSSPLTPAYKYVIPGMWAATIIATSVWIAFLSGDLRSMFILLMILPALPMLRVSEVWFDDEFVYVSNFRETKKYFLRDVKSLNEYSVPTIDPTYELEIFVERGEILKVDFLPKLGDSLHYQYKGEHKGNTLVFKRKVQAIKRAMLSA